MGNRQSPWLATAFLWAGLGSALAQPAAEIVGLSGQGENRPATSSPWQAAHLRQTLDPGADMRTLAQSSAALLLADRTQLRLGPLSLLRLNPPAEGKTALELSVGRLWSRTKREPADLELRTPAAVAAVRGTDWDVEVDADGRTLLTVLSGQIEVSNPQGAVTVGASEQAEVRPGQAPVKRLLVRPRERVQWVAAWPVMPMRYREFRVEPLAPTLAALAQALTRGDLAEARNRIEVELRQPDAPEVLHLLRADLLAQAGEPGAAAELLAQRWNQHAEARVAARRADLLLALDDTEGAATLLDQALRRHPKAPELLATQAELLRLQGRGEEAVARYRQAVAQVPVDDTLQLAQLLARWGSTLAERGDLAPALQLLAQAEQQHPNHPPVMGEHATVLADALQLAPARALLERALQQSGDDYVSLASAGQVALQAGDAAGARLELLKATLIEPRHARAQVWLAVAELQLGHLNAALDSLERASQADPLDPLPWQMRATVLNDQGRPAEAIAASREALARLPYLKSLNALATDSQGSTNLGKALGDFGLEHWARAYAQASYYPLWGGSHFFLADRAENEHDRKSELFQGYLTDPLALGASEKLPPLMLQPQQQVSMAGSLGQESLRHTFTTDLIWRGLALAPSPTAWLLRVSDVEYRPRVGPAATQYRLSSPGLDLAIGMRPTERLSLFVLANTTPLRYQFDTPLDLGNGVSFGDVARNRAQRLDAGMSWRWGSQAQTWFKLHGAHHRSALTLDDVQWGPQDYRFSSREHGQFVRHTHLFGPHRLSLGWEAVSQTVNSNISDPLVASPRTNTAGYHMPWVAGEWRSGPWSLALEAYWPRLRFSQLDRFTDSLTDEDLLTPQSQTYRAVPKTLPRAGLSYRWDTARALHWAHQQHVRAPGTHTLSPTQTGGIALDNTYTLPGSHARRNVLQLDWEIDAATFVGLRAQDLHVRNATNSTGRLYAQDASAMLDAVTSIAPVRLNSQTTLSHYEGNALFASGDIRDWSASINRVLTPRWSLLGSYIHTQASNTAAGHEGLQLPDFARHTVLAQTTYALGPRHFALLRATWRGRRWADADNTVPKPAGWGAAVAWGWESADRRWSMVAAALGLARKDTDPSYWLLVRWRP